MLGKEAEPTHESHRLIESAFNLAASHIAAVVSPHDKKNWGDILNRWLEFIEYNASVILLKVSSDANAYRMFETLNDRGLRTSQADLIKNYLFGESGDRVAEVQHKWSTMRALLEALDEDDITITFLRQSLIAMHGYLREGEVYEKVQAIARRPSGVVAFMTELESMAADYVAMFHPEHEKWNRYDQNVRRAIEAINLLAVRPMRPLVLAVSLRFDPKEAVAAFDLFVSWAVRLLIASTTRSGSVEQPMADRASEVFVRKIKTARELASALEKVIPTDIQFREAMLTASVAKASLARYYLRSLERAAKAEDHPWYIPNDDQSAINLEHVLPRNPGKEWTEVSEDLHRIYVRRLGNLALIQARSTSDLKSAAFEQKREVFAQSPYELTKQIAEEAVWDVGAIERRQEALAELAVSAWPI